MQSHSYYVQLREQFMGRPSDYISFDNLIPDIIPYLYLEWNGNISCL